MKNNEEARSRVIVAMIEKARKKAPPYKT